jgi:hypothetical protein
VGVKWLPGRSISNPAQQPEYSAGLALPRHPATAAERRCARTVRVTAEHKAALARALQSRHRKLCAGTLYNPGDERPKDFAEGISIDLRLIFIGLIECLGSRRAAEDTLKDIIAVFLSSFDPAVADRRLIEAKRFNLDRQFEMVRAWQASGTNGNLEAVLSIGARLLFGTAADSSGISKILVRDARPLYVRTLHVFGRGVRSASLARTASIQTGPPATPDDHSAKTLGRDGGSS